MRPIFLLSFLLQLFTVTYCQLAEHEAEFLLTGQAKGMEHKWLFLTYLSNDGNYLRDSSLVSSNKFQFKIKVSEPTYAIITSLTQKSWPIDNPNFFAFFLEPANMHIKLSNGFDHPIVTGSKTQVEWMQLEALKTKEYSMVKPLNEQYNSYNNEYIEKIKAGVTDSVLYKKMDSLRTEMKPYRKKLGEIEKSYFKAHPNSYVTAYQLRYYIRGSSVTELNNYFSQMSIQLQQSQFGKYIKSAIDKLIKGSVGSVATNFATKELRGDSLRLTDFKGRYVLLDFWASWCKPCRAGNPELIKLYTNYKDKGIEFIGVSDDDFNEDKWKAAIEKDGIAMWKHVLRGHGPEITDTENDLNSYYGIQSIPTRILINPSGLIVGRFGDGGEPEEKLSLKLKEIFK